MRSDSHRVGVGVWWTVHCRGLVTSILLVQVYNLLSINGFGNFAGQLTLIGQGFCLFQVENWTAH